MAVVSLRDLNKIFTDPKTHQEVYAVHNLNLEIHDGEFLVLVGPSGCGKTTALRMVAGLEDISSGEIRIGERVVNDVLARDRDIAMVFQNYALYPHMSVYQNMAFGLKLRELPGFWKRLTQWKQSKEKLADIDKRVRAAAKQLDLEHLLGRKPSQLSGGQRQRVALGRAVVRQPSVFLMDEPLSNLDAKLRVQTRAELVGLHRRLGVTTIYVTHDQVEAMTMGQRIAVMRDGELQQCDTPSVIYSNPVNMFVAGFIGMPSMNFLRGFLTSENGRLSVDIGITKVLLPPERFANAAKYLGKEVVFGIRPEDIHAAEMIPPSAGSHLCRVSMTVNVIEPMGAQNVLFLKSGEINIISSVNAVTRPEMGDQLEIAMDCDNAHLFDAETERVI
jgi:multiple sugar transport system ATP-binding protein